MKLKKILLGLAYMSVMASCADLDYHEYTVYDKDYVFTDFGRTGAVVTNIYSYLDYDLPSALLVMRRNLRGVGLQYMIG